MDMTEVKDLIKAEYEAFKDDMYAKSSDERRKQLDQFFTPYQITIPMIEKFPEIKGKNILDPTCGSGNLLAACIIAGADADKVFGNEIDADMVIACRERIKTIPDRLKAKGYIEEAEKIANNLTKFRDWQIHQGNALHKFCLNYFADDYDKIYFENVKQDKAIEKRLNSDKNAQGAIIRLKKYHENIYKESFATEEDLKYYNKKDNVDESKVTTANIVTDEVAQENSKTKEEELW